MREDEPLEGWLSLVNMWAKHRPKPQAQGGGREALDRLAQALAAQPEGKVNYDRIRGGVLSVYARQALSPDEATDAQQLYLQVWERGGSGMSYVTEGLLQGVALGLNPASVPFWRQLLDLRRSHDQSAAKRRTMALAALALLAIARDDSAAYTALAEAIAHTHEQVRALAAFYLARAYAVPQRPLPASVEAALVEMATRDRAFAVRFQARAALRTLGRPTPQDDPALVYLLKVQLRGNRATRTIAVRPHNTLSQLHYAIQSAFGWDADHLYSFYMSGSRDDRRYEIVCPQPDDNWDFGPWSFKVISVQEPGAVQEVVPLDEDEEDEEDGEDEEDEEFADGDELYTTNATIGGLGLVLKHQFIYFFDYGDSHQFIVTVLGIEPQADTKAYPRVVEVQGKAPRQYHSYEDEDDEEEA